MYTVRMEYNQSVLCIFGSMNDKDTGFMIANKFISIHSPLVLAVPENNNNMAMTINNDIKTNMSQPDISQQNNTKKRHNRPWENENNNDNDNDNDNNNKNADNQETQQSHIQMPAANRNHLSTNETPISQNGNQTTNEQPQTQTEESKNKEESSSDSSGDSDDSSDDSSDGSSDDSESQPLAQPKAKKQKLTAIVTDINIQPDLYV